MVQPTVHRLALGAWLSILLVSPATGGGAIEKTNLDPGRGRTFLMELIGLDDNGREKRV